ncbi:mitochondrial fission process protein 1 isoform X2 [Manduca sexta]|uniref:Mitochondrial fission process protein 1 n=1 Tax=Manduca sexta TaxID=7130 RepID=A0A921YQ29_MANSE|nr:mitochondrial fission process protein 1 isoform X2 [Manduca sexta]KAG6443065.1 hypothetical protein O3G_MSEX002610 [Manduca sexta]
MAEVKKDFFRDTWVRYLGYANEVGESFRSVVPARVVRASYSVAFAYVLADTGHKGWEMVKKDGRPRMVVVETSDALLWQTLASVIIPGFTINRICAVSNSLLTKHAKKIPPNARNWVTVAIGLASIPVIVHPIDAGVTVLMDMTYRKWVKS